MSRQKEIINNPYVKRNLPRWNGSRWVILVLLFPSLSFIYGTILLYAYKVLSPSYRDAILVMQPVAAAWYFTGILLAIGTTGLWMNRLFQLYNAARHKPLPFNAPKPNFNGLIVLKIIAVLFCTAALIFAILIYDNYVLVYKDKLVVNKLSSFKEKTYAMHEVSSITFIERVRGRTKIKYNPRHIIGFDDGSVYETKDNMLDDDSLASYLARQNTIRIDSLPVERNND